MADIERIKKGLECCSFPARLTCLGCPYHSGGIEGCAQLAKDVLELLKEQEEREKAICMEICEFIRGGCSTDTDDDKDFVCYEIQRCFTNFGRR